MVFTTNYGQMLQMTACKNAELAFIYLKSTLIIVCADGVLWSKLCSLAQRLLSVSVRLQSTHFVPITEVTKVASYETGCGSAGFKKITHLS